jgi:hypothetical protein
VSSLMRVSDCFSASSKAVPELSCRHLVSWKSLPGRLFLFCLRISRNISRLRLRKRPLFTRAAARRRSHRNQSAWMLTAVYLREGVYLCRRRFQA